MSKLKDVDPGFISSAWLLWVGSEHYEKIEDYTSEAIVLGISKRLPSVHVGRAMMEPGAVVFVAHDEGKKKECRKCAGQYECPDCRKRTEEITQLRNDIDRMVDRYREFPRDESWDKNAPRAARSFVALREGKMIKLAYERGHCAICSGEGSIHGGTGGSVELDNGVKWDYRKYNYFLHQPKKFDPESVKKKKMCATCGGIGELPEAQIFGVFVPEKLEYILSGEESPEALALIPDVEKVGPDALKVESKRKCGKRKPGGYYVVTSADFKTSDDAEKTLRELEKRGLVGKGEVDVAGSFVRFRKPLKVNEKRFRGVKRLEMSKISKAARIEAADIREAMA